jgi:proteasome accessory factor C
VSGRNAAEESRERLIALVLLLQSASRQRPLTQESIVRELKVDEYPVTGRGPRKIRAYEGNDGAVRQKFERDKARIRELGFQIETAVLDVGVGYWIEPDSANAPLINFTEDEERVVQLALRFCGFGANGAFSLFNEGPAGGGGLEFTNYYTPVLRALNLRRALSYDYQSSTNKTRVVEPLAVGVFSGVSYLVARVRGTHEIKGYRFNRMTSMPVVLADTFEVEEAELGYARAWRPQFSRTPAPVDIVVATSRAYADLLVRQFPNALAVEKKGGQCEVGITFDNPREALRFVLEAADRVRLRSPKTLRHALAQWLEQVNRGEVPDLSSVVFAGPSTNDVLGQTLQLLHAVYLADDGLRVSELASRFSMDPSLVRRIMDRLVTFEPMGGAFGFPAHVVKECDDWDHEETDDSTYHAEFFGRDGWRQPSPLLWRDLFELNIALREASRVYADPALGSAVDKIEAAINAFVHVETSSNEASLVAVQGAIEAREQIKIEYTAGVAEAPTYRSIEPREVKVLNGHTYVRAYCTTREAWRTFRVDRIGSVLAKSPVTEERPADHVVNWLTQVGEEGDEVVVVVEASLRWLFEPLPNAQWCALGDGRHAVRFRVSNEVFLDHLMLQAGAGAVVATATFAKAGHELSARIAAQL